MLLPRLSLYMCARARVFIFFICVPVLHTWHLGYPIIHNSSAGAYSTNSASVFCINWMNARGPMAYSQLCAYWCDASCKSKRDMAWAKQTCETTYVHSMCHAPPLRWYWRYFSSICNGSMSYNSSQAMQHSLKRYCQHTTNVHVSVVVPLGCVGKGHPRSQTHRENLLFNLPTRPRGLLWEVTRQLFDQFGFKLQTSNENAQYTHPSP